MIQLSDLIAGRSPDGLQFKSLDEIGVLYGGLTGKSKADFAGGDARFVSYVNIFNNLSTNVTPVDRVTVADGERQNRVRYGDVLFTASSESANEVGMASGVTSEPPEPLYLNSFCFGLRPHNVDCLDPEFAKHLFRSHGVRKQIIRTSNGVTRINISKERFRGIKIPIPPLAIQREIASLLDEMATLKAELEAELEAELDLRSRQYAFYRDQLLTFREAGDVRWIPMRDAGEWFGGGTPSKAVAEFWNDGTVPWLSPKDMVSDMVVVTEDHIAEVALERSPLKLVPAGSVAFVVRSNILRRRMPVALVPMAVTLNQDMRAVVPAEGIVGEYLFQACRANAQRILAVAGRTDGSMAAIQSRGLLEFEIPIPSVEEQRRIASLLGTFDALVNDLSIGLSAEVAARRAQYEHYRDRLLTFDEAVA